MKKKIVSFVIVFSALFIAYAISSDSKLLAIDAKANISIDVSAIYTVTQKKVNGEIQKTVSQIYRRDKDDKFIVLINEPKQDKGKGYLRIGESMWLFDPRDHQFVLTNVRERFQSSNARLSDFTGSSWAHDFNIVSERKEKLGQFDCTVYNLKAQRNDVIFPTSTIWVDANNLVRKCMDYAISGNLLRTVLIPSWQETTYGWIPSKILITDNLKGSIIDGKFVGEATQITITNVKTEKLPDSIFSKEYLEVNQK